MSKNSNCFHRALCVVMACFVLSGCVADRLKFWESESKKPSFDVGGLDDNAELSTYIKDIIDNGLTVEVESETDSDSTDVSYTQETVRQDVLKAMRASGYYNAAVALEGTESEPAYVIEAGEATTISSITVLPSNYSSHLSGLNLKEGDVLAAQRILDEQYQLRSLVEENSCAYDLDIGHSVFLDPKTNSAEVIFHVDEGREAQFGGLTFSGHETIKQEFFDQILTWDEGSCFKYNVIDNARSTLLASGLFSRADIVLPDNVQDLDVIPVTIEVQERAQRTVSAGVSFYTDEGVGLILGWEHRNFLGKGEKFEAEFTANQLEQALNTTLTKTHFYHKDQSLSLKANLVREDTDAFERLGVETGFAIQRDINPRFSARVGADLSFNQITEENESANNFVLLSPFASLSFDSRDDPLNAKKGALVRASFAPSIDVLGESDPFIKNEFTAQKYYQVHEKLVIASRVHVGSVVGASTEDLPASERFFSGGGGSVRGFGFQEVGPFEDGDPVGGRSVVEGALELRFNITETIGGVAFVDAGQVDDKVFPSLTEVSVGAGLGARYYTDFGPLRFDVGVPISGDDNTDDSFQVYISIGQAF